METYHEGKIANLPENRNVDGMIVKTLEDYFDVQIYSNITIGNPS
jgi:hypothetical protein